MAIPPIPSYAIPAVPQHRAANWRLESHRAALLVHDMQNYFLAAYDHQEDPISTVVANLAALLKKARAQGMPVFYSAQPPRQHPHQRGLLSDVWGPGLQTEEEAEIIAQLRPASGDQILSKWRYSAFERTNLAQAMGFAGRDQLIITGVYGHMGCQVSAGDAFMKDIQPFLVSDAVADFTAAEHAQALEWVAKRCGVVLDTAGALRQLTESAAGSAAGQPSGNK